jgi:quinol monooxygenase YgiN
MRVVIFKVRCRAGQGDRAAGLLSEVIKPSREVAGVLGFDIARDLVDPDSFIATEVFDDRAALARQEELPQVAAVMAAFPDLLNGDPEATIYHVSSEPYTD